MGKLRLFFDHFSNKSLYYYKTLLETVQKVGKIVDIHFFENVSFEKQDWKDLCHSEHLSVQTCLFAIFSLIFGLMQFDMLKKYFFGRFKYSWSCDQQELGYILVQKCEKVAGWSRNVPNLKYYFQRHVCVSIH